MERLKKNDKLKAKKGCFIKKKFLDLTRLKEYVVSGTMFKDSHIPAFRKKMREIWQRVYDSIPVDDENFTSLLLLMAKFNSKMKKIEMSAKSKRKDR